MRVLLPFMLRRLFEAGNGELLKNAESEFNVLVKMDQDIPQQQNLSEIKMGTVLLEAEGNRYKDFAPLMNQVNTVLRTIKEGQVVSVRA